MILPLTHAPKPKAVTINGQPHNLVAFYWPDKDMPWDLVFEAQFLANFYPCNFSLTINNTTATFANSEAAFQATKCWDTPQRQMFEAAQCPTGTQAFANKKKITNPDPSYAGLGGYGAMVAVLTAKFSDPILKQALLDTHDAYLLEHNVPGRADPGGWSDLHDGHKAGDPLGKTLNHLGKALMEVRLACGGVGAPSGTYAVSDFSAHAG
jgi:predicted NAD-dependent protein-ADP-ribosyltransferase YbiA (DUF1768 family)